MNNWIKEMINIKKTLINKGAIEVYMNIKRKKYYLIKLGDDNKKIKI